MIEIISLFAVYLAIFIFGMTVMRIGLFNLSGNKINTWLIKFTSNPLKGFLTGIIITAIVQSSSAVMVLVVGLIATGYLTFKQSIGVILGTNIGTTFTTELITFDIFEAILPLLLIGFLCLFMKNRQVFSTGAILFGLGCLFVSMNGFEQLAKPISLFPAVNAFFHSTNNSDLLGIGLGTLITAVIQSSTATTGIIMGFMNEHVLSLNAGIAIILGANIGTCVTAYLASIGSTNEAKLAAYTHIWLNIIGVILFYPFIQALGDIAKQFTSLPDVQLAHVSLIFNTLTSVIALPFVGLIATFIVRFHRKRV